MIDTESPQSALSLRAVTRRFGGLLAVRDVSLDVPQGARRAILGPNGAGKTTLFNLIAGETSVSSGAIHVFGIDVTLEAARFRVRRGLARTYQRSNLFAGLTVRENLELSVTGRSGPRYSAILGRGARAERDQLIEQVSERTGISGSLGEQVGAMSHGRQRQLEIGMALAAQPRILILDEPAAGLSPSERELLTGLLQSLPAALTVLLIEHDMDVALAVADGVTLMHDGAVVFEGTPDEVNSSELVHDLYLGNKHA